MKKIIKIIMVIGIIYSMSSANVITIVESTIISDEQQELLDEYGYEIEVVDVIADEYSWGFNPAGVCNSVAKTIKIDDSYMDWAFNHEYGHFIDSINDYISYTDEFYEIVLEEYLQLYEITNSEYSVSSSVEYFASAYKVYLEGGDTLENLCPKTFECFEELTNK